MSIPTDTPEHDSHSDSDWLDVASTDRDSDDNDSIYSSKETDHEDPSRSRSRRSSLSYGSSRDGDVDAWEGLIEDSADEGVPSDVLAPSTHVASVSQCLAAFDLDHAQKTSSEELRVKEGLDQSMVSTLSSSRSSSLHASTVHNSSRDLRLSFPDPITSSCREPLSTSYEEIQLNSDLTPSSPDSDSPSVDDEEMSSASQVLSIHSQETPVLSLHGLELKVFLYGFPTIFKWSIVNRLLQKVARGAGLVINSDLENLQGSIRRLTVSGSSERDPAFPRIITVFDRTLHPYDMSHDHALIHLSDIHPLAIVFVPCRPLVLPKHVFCLPIVSSSYSSDLPDFGDVEMRSPQFTWDMLNVPDRQILRITASEGPSVIDKDSIDAIDPARAYCALSRLWSCDNVNKGMIASTHALTIIAILSLILGLVVRAALPVSLQQFSSPTLATLAPNCSADSFWQMLRPLPHRERLPTSTTLDSSVIVMPSPLRDLSLSVFSSESTPITLSRTNPTNFRRMAPPTLSDRAKFSKDLMLQPPSSVLLPDNRPKALSVIPDKRPIVTYRPSPDTTARALSIHGDASVSGVVKECASAVLAIVNQDMQDIFDALDALAQAISRQTQMILTKATTFVEQSAMYWEKSVKSFETVRGTLHTHNERARTRAKEIRAKASKWLYDASEAATTGARFSTEMAWEWAEGFAYRAQRARGRAKEMATEIQGFFDEREVLDVLGIDAWELHAKHWEEWVQRLGNQGRTTPCKRKLKTILC